jgi:DNA helicase II / ATP-dependent DNA helicase PcrA
MAPRAPNLDGMNPEQRLAVETVDGPLLVLAGAGSGKTRVIVHRIAHLLSLGADPRSILAVTFTNKAAAEMRERVSKLTGRAVAEHLTVSTFHSFGVRVLQEHAKKVGLNRRFAIFDTQDQLAVVKRLLQQIAYADRSFDQKRLLSMISRAKNAGLDPAGFIVRAKEDDPYEVLLCELYPRYQRALAAMGAVDFDDLILLPLMLVKAHEDVREAYRSRFRHVMVDEYQDTSRVQVRFLETLVGEGGNVCAVGDDDQSIYAWRGAEVDNILRFERSFPGAREIRLTRNYRSTGNILDCANAVIARNAARRGKDLWTETGAGEPVRVVICADDDEEAVFVVDELERLAAEERLGRDDFAILFRTNGQARPFEEVMRSRGIDHRIVGGTRFFDRKEVRDAVAYLRACANPRDDVSLGRIVNYPARGIGDATLERVQAHARESGRSLWEALRGVESVPGCERAAGAVLEFVDLLERHRAAFQQRRGLGETARRLFEEAGLPEAIRTSVKSAAAGAARAANLDALVASIAAYESREPKPSLPQYLTRISLDGRDEDEAGDKGKVTLLTLHAAKGLEFPVVFLAGMEEDLLPHGGMQGEAQNLPEERRLAYVGITRAQRRLYLTRARVRRRRGRIQETIPSRFLEDLPEACIETVDASAPVVADESKEIEAGRAFFDAMRARLGTGD